MVETMHQRSFWVLRQTEEKRKKIMKTSLESVQIKN